MGDFLYYNELLFLSYRELVHLLIKKYGEVTDDYFSEKSYTRFLNGEIKTIAKGKFSRALEGLYCHHIFENKYENIGDLEFIRAYKYPHELQRKGNLVYCDLVEHLILHVWGHWNIHTENSGRNTNNIFYMIMKVRILFCSMYNLSQIFF
jgi:hypothetical protein